jgi:hypothetical protein
MRQLLLTSFDRDNNTIWQYIEHINGVLILPSQSVAANLKEVFQANCLLDESGVCLISSPKREWIIMVDPEDRVISFIGKSVVKMDSERSTLEEPSYIIAKPDRGFRKLYFRGFDEQSRAWWRNYGSRNTDADLSGIIDKIVDVIVLD